MRLLPALLASAVLLAAVLAGTGRPAAAPEFRAGAAVVDISPTRFPVRVNGMFTERSADKVVDPLTARALALDDGTTRLVFCVVDSCMVPRPIIDRAKAEASAATGIPTTHFLVSATHTHSAPSAMGCLGSREDPEYAAILPGRIAAALIAAAGNLQPARIGWTGFDDWEHTHNRRWIRRPDRILNDPFGRPTVRANMHPGHQSPDVTGPSGPVDPQITMLAVETTDGKPLALLANYSMHYQGSPMLSSDYFWRFNAHIARLLGAGEGFVGIMSQGTSGDLWSGDYASPAKPPLAYDAYAQEIASRVAAAYRKIAWQTRAPLAAAETAMTLDYRTPDAERVRWAEEMKSQLGDRLPRTQPEIYALEALTLHERRRTELKLQALRIGELGVTAIPNEVFCLTGLKLKARSPLPLTMNISLANGADGYIPPPEQHALGGYTTWPARTAGLEVDAEPKIIAALVGLLEKVSGKPARREQAPETDHAKAVAALKPVAFFRMEEMDAGTARDNAGKHDAVIEPGVAVHLPGIGSKEAPHEPPAERAFHFAGGRVKPQVILGANYSAAFFLWNALPTNARPVTGYAFSRGADGDKDHGEHLGVGGTHRANAQGRLMLFNGNSQDQLLVGKTPLTLKHWHHVVLVREGTKVRVHLDGQAQPDMEGELPVVVPGDALFIGGRADNFANWEGKLDEFAVFDRALTADEIAVLYKASGLKPPPITAAAPEFPPLSPEDALKSIHVPDGFKVELVACEPQVMDPIAIDWDLAGRLWVVEMADYPSGMDNHGKPGGRVSVLEDADGDGRHEKSTLFADALNFPTGLLTWRDGVIVTAAPDILFLKDTNGDGKADSTEKLLSGLSEGNQQLRANGLRWGLDNRVYCAAGGHHGGHAADTVLRSHKDGQDVKVGSRDFSFDPDSGDVRAESGPSQFGRNRDDAGHWFGTQNSRALFHYVLPDHYLQRNPHVPAPNPAHLVVGPLNAPVYPVSPPEKRFHSFENAGHFTSACSGMIYRDELLWPRRENELDALTCEPFHNLVQHNILVEDGVTFRSKRAPGEEQHDFFASTDRWCRPVMTRTGPDGALWVVDMYRYMIEHPAWLPDNGKAETLPFYRLGEDKGRIYRVFRADKPPRKVKPMDKLKPVELAAALDSPNGLARDKAHMALRWEQDHPNRLADMEQSEMVSEMLQHAHKLSSPFLKLHLMGYMEGERGHYPEALRGLLKDRAIDVRESAVRVALSLSYKGNLDIPMLSAIMAAAEDDSARVRFQFAISAGNCTEGRDRQEAGKALCLVAIRDHTDPWMRAAVMSSAIPHLRALCEGIAAAGGEAFAAYADGLIATALGENDREALAAMLRPLLSGEEKQRAGRFRSLARFLVALQGKGKTRQALTDKADALTEALRGIGAVQDAAQSALRNPDAAADLRIASAELLAAEKGTRPAVLEITPNWLSPGSDAALQLAAVRVLASTNEAIVPAMLLHDFPALTPQTRGAALDTLLSREPWALALLEHLKANPAVALDAVQRARLAQHSSKKVRNLAAAVLKAESSRKEVLEQFRPALSLKGDAARGKTVAMRCIACHQVEGTGLQIGPDLRSVASHPAEKLLTNIIDPSLDVQPGYFAFNAKLKGGSELYGLITAETGNSVSFKLPDGSTKLVARGDIAELKSTGQSLMPSGLEAGMTSQDMADLIAWLRQGR